MIQFTTKRLAGRAFTAQDQEACLDILTDPVVAKTYMLPEYAAREDAIPLFLRLMALSQSQERLVVGIYLQDHLIGWINDTEQKDDSMEVGYVLHPAYHNQGYMSEALTAAIAELFAKGFRQIKAGAFEENVASIRVMEKCGMTRLEQQDEVEYRGKNHRCVYYAIGYLDRVRRMEEYLDHLQQVYAVDPDSASQTIQNDADLSAMRDVLTRYMESGQWLQDYEAEERGEFPRDLKRGVLSQDTLYDFLQEIRN